MPHFCGFFPPTPATDFDWIYILCTFNTPTCTYSMYKYHLEVVNDIFLLEECTSGDDNCTSRVGECTSGVGECTSWVGECTSWVGEYTSWVGKCTSWVGECSFGVGEHSSWGRECALWTAKHTGGDHSVKKHGEIRPLQISPNIFVIKTIKLLNVCNTP